jgi:tetratricopeptide (TPR) repeat protein
MIRRLPIIYLVPALAMGFIQCSGLTRVTAARAQGSAPAAAPSALPSAASQKRLEFLERAFFFKLFPNDSLDTRLERLEKQVFGVTMNGTTDHRLETLESAVHETDPGTGKPLAPRNNLRSNEVEKKLFSSAAPPPVPPVVSTVAPQQSSSQPEQTLTAPEIAPNPDKSSNSVVANPEPINSVLHIGKDRFAVDGNPVQYIHEVTEAMQMHPQDGSLAFERAKAEIQLNRWDRALSDLSDAIMSVPSNAELYLARALVYTRIHNSVLATEDLKQARFYNSKLPKTIDFEEHGLASKK